MLDKMSYDKQENFSIGIYMNWTLMLKNRLFNYFISRDIGVCWR